MRILHRFAFLHLREQQRPKLMDFISDVGMEQRIIDIRDQNGGGFDVLNTDAVQIKDNSFCIAQSNFF